MELNVALVEAVGVGECWDRVKVREALLLREKVRDVPVGVLVGRERDGEALMVAETLGVEEVERESVKVHEVDDVTREERLGVAVPVEGVRLLEYEVVQEQVVKEGEAVGDGDGVCGLGVLGFVRVMVADGDAVTDCEGVGLSERLPETDPEMEPLVLSDRDQETLLETEDVAVDVGDADCDGPDRDAESDKVCVRLAEAVTRALRLPEMEGDAVAEMETETGVRDVSVGVGLRVLVGLVRVGSGVGVMEAVKLGETLAVTEDRDRDGGDRDELGLRLALRDQERRQDTDRDGEQESEGVRDVVTGRLALGVALVGVAVARVGVRLRVGDGVRLRVVEREPLLVLERDAVKAGDGVTEGDSEPETECVLVGEREGSVGEEDRE